MSDTKPLSVANFDADQFHELISRDVQVILQASQKVMLDDTLIKTILDDCLDQAWKRYSRGGSVESIRGRLYRRVITRLVNQYIIQMNVARAEQTNEKTP